MSPSGRRAYDAAPKAEELRALRLWHWKQARGASHVMDTGRVSREIRERARDDWNRHMGFVQLLNDFFPIGDTAEQDQQREIVKADRFTYPRITTPSQRAEEAIRQMDSDIQDDIDSWRGG